MEHSSLPIKQLLPLAIQAIDKMPNDETYDQYLAELEAYECWDTWFKLIKSHLTRNPSGFLSDMTKCARVQAVYLEDVHAVADTCKQIVDSSGISFESFRQDVLAKIIGPTEFFAEGEILQKIWERFSSNEDRIKALERICLIYEKKIPNDKLLHLYFDRLLKVHPQNTKALRHFKTLNTQNEDWIAVVEILRKLLACAKRPQEGFRHAQELAAVYLYQLNKPEVAIQILEEYCKNSTLDISTIHYEAYYRLGNFDGCLKVLRTCLASIEDPHTRAIIYYRSASILDKMQNYPKAYENFENAFKLDDTFLDALEGLISTSIKMKKWPSVKEWLTIFSEHVKSPQLSSQVRSGLSRLEEGLSIAHNQ
jgi:tetratricopeptide (TPR) repeat protein